MTKTQIERLERDEQTLTTAIPMNVTQRNQIMLQLQQVRQQIALLETKLEETEQQHETLSTAAPTIVCRNAMACCGKVTARRL
jgi:hypothetical protein